MRLPLRVLIVDPSISDGKAIYEALAGLPQVESSVSPPVTRPFFRSSNDFIQVFWS
jgi:hypothetical protein